MISPQRKMLVATGLLLGGVIAFSMAATQYIAWHPALGSPWIGQIHAPWRWLDWQARFGAVAPEIFQTLHAGLGLAGILISAGLLTLASSSHRKPKRHDGIHGTAHWAAPHEVEEQCKASRSEIGENPPIRPRSSALWGPRDY